ncbi:MAG TPA: acyl carrier protein [Nitrospiria bacterium]|jgi:acyl carrier protein|nr:acyl carrier protein [Nitrospiria bacterium]
MQPIEQQLRQFVINNFLFGQGGDQLSNHDSFLEKGIVDSTGVLELVAFLEDQYRIKIEDEELIPANLDSIDSLIRFIEKKAQRTP